MRIGKVIGAAGIISLIVAGFGGVVLAQGQVTPQQVIQKVKQAVKVLEQSQGKDLSAFDNPKGPWVFGDSYVVLQDCAKGTVAAHPLVPGLVGKKAVGLQDVKGDFFFVEVCQAGKKPGGGWVQYWFPKPHAKKPSRKLAYCLLVPGTSLVATAGVYSNTLKLSDLNKMIHK